MTMTDLDADITRWRAAITKSPVVDAADADELEGHLREQVADLVVAGLSNAEAFQIAVQRLGQVDQLTAEFAREHSDRLWKQLSLAAPAGEKRNRPLIEMIAFAALGVVIIQVARILAGIPHNEASWFTPNLGFFVLTALLTYFAWRRRPSTRFIVIAAALLVALAVAINLYPLREFGQSRDLIAIHLGVLLWFVVGAVYLGKPLTSAGRRMEFVRFSGEWAIYFVLLSLGGGVLTSLTGAIIAPIAPEAFGEIMIWILPSGAAAAVVVAAWLVEAKKGIVENLAPVLAAIFTPLFAAMSLVAAVVYLVSGIRTFDRDLVTVLDVLLLVVFGLVLYALSARDPAKPAGVMDVVRLVAVLAALVLDVLVLGSMFARVSELGLTANRTAALGLNLILVVNLAVTAWLQIGMLRTRGTAVALERWQTRFLPVFGVWAAVVVLVLPVVFKFA
jgi:hypothetical protein